MTERTVIVLGATGGLGRAVTERFRDDGASVLAFDARIPAAGERQDRVEYVAVDALDETSVSAAFARVPSAAAEDSERTSLKFRRHSSNGQRSAISSC